MRIVFAALVSAAAIVACDHSAAADPVDDKIAVIRAVGPMGQGSAGARQAANELASHAPEILPRLLSAMDTSNIVAANWYRTVFETIAAREFARSVATFPVDELKAYFRDATHQGRARRLVLDLLNRIEPAFGAHVVPTLLDDPEFRDDAVATLLKQGDDAKSQGNVAAARKAYSNAFLHARNSTQVTAAAGGIESLGQKVSIVEHLGFVTDWFVVGPFDAPGMSGFRTSFPPETTVDLAAPISANDGRMLRWSRHSTIDPLGTVDLVKAIAPVKEAVGYAYAELVSPTEQDAQIRCSADDNLSVWLNGEKVFGREMWLNGTRFDRFITPVRLKAGGNRVLVKICQGPQHRDPSVGNAWTFQLRICKPDGAGLGLKSRLVNPGPSNAAVPGGAAPAR